MKSILIAEDDEHLAKIYQIKLQKYYKTSIATSGQDAIIKTINEKPDLIILDLMLPGGINGFDVIKKLKQNEKTKDIPIIVATNMGESQRQTAIEQGVSEYITKTAVTPNQVESIVKKHLGG